MSRAILKETFADAVATDWLKRPLDPSSAARDVTVSMLGRSVAHSYTINQKTVSGLLVPYSEVLSPGEAGCRRVVLGFWFNRGLPAMVAANFPFLAPQQAPSLRKDPPVAGESREGFIVEEEPRRRRGSLGADNVDFPAASRFLLDMDTGVCYVVDWLPNLEVGMIGRHRYSSKAGRFEVDIVFTDIAAPGLLPAKELHKLRLRRDCWDCRAMNTMCFCASHVREKQFEPYKNYSGLDWGAFASKMESIIKSTSHMDTFTAEKLSIPQSLAEATFHIRTKTTFSLVRQIDGQAIGTFYSYAQSFITVGRPPTSSHTSQIRLDSRMGSKMATEDVGVTPTTRPRESLEVCDDEYTENFLDVNTPTRFIEYPLDEAQHSSTAEIGVFTHSEPVLPFTETESLSARPILSAPLRRPGFENSRTGESSERFSHRARDPARQDVSKPSARGRGRRDARDSGQRQMRQADGFYHCPMDSCQYRVSQLAHLKVHVKGRHLRERPYRCDSCGRDFTTGSNRNRHRRETHDGERRRREKRTDSRPTEAATGQTDKNENNSSSSSFEGLEGVVF